MKTNRFFSAIITILAAFSTAVASAQNIQVSSIPSGNIISQSGSNGFTFSSAGSKAGVIRYGNGMITVSGTFTFNNNDTLYIGEGVNFNPDYISGFSAGCVIVNYGNSNISNAFFTGGHVYNYGTASFGYFAASNAQIINYGTMSSLNGCMLEASAISNHGSFTSGFLGMSGDASSIVNSAEGTMAFTSSVRVAGNGSKFQNEGGVKVAGFFNSEVGSVILNNGRLQLDADVAIAGNVINKGMFISHAGVDMKSSASIINTCRLVAAAINNNGGEVENYGLLWITADMFNAFENGGKLKNAGYIRTTEIHNNAGATIANKVNNAYTNNQQKNGYIRIEGGAQSFESVNAGTITGGNICDAHNAGFALDTTGTAMTASVQQIGSFDTTNYTAASFISCNCASPVTVTNDTVATAVLTGSIAGNSNELQWTLNTATGMSTIELQAASNEMEFAALQSYSNANTAPAQYLDQQPSEYYRLKMSWNDGSVTFSNVIRLARHTAVSNVEFGTVAAFPNPFNDRFNISLNMTQQETVRVEVLDITGKAVSVADFAAQAGNNSFNLTGLQNIAPAMYILRAQALESGRSFSTRIVKQ
ncbi:T9SS type A sorting domain-containing protein [Chitinophagaceae bacterium MMS25-I14]